MKLRLLAFIAKTFGIQFHVDGLPYGAPFRANRITRQNCGHGTTDMAAH